MRQLEFTPTFEGWQTAARHALAAQWAPDTIVWEEADAKQQALFQSLSAPESGPPQGRVPKLFVETGSLVARHSNSQKWPLLYRLLWRLTHAEARLLENPLDADVLQLSHYAKEVEKDAYRMRAFLRFRETRVDEGPWFIAWYEPEHDTIELNAKFFVDRFANMRWSILTPRRCMHWDGSDVSFSPGASRANALHKDDIEPLWIAYYSSIFNPARLKPKAMQAQLLKRNWKNLPEAVVIDPLMRAAPGRTAAMIDRAHQVHSFPLVPDTADMETLRSAASACRACPLWRNATCTVFGEGSATAQTVLIGEQPGDSEDLAGKPFVGPAGQLLDRALAAASVDRSQLYVTNAVKHFKWEPRGKRRIHQTPNSRDIASCRPWLQGELRALRPATIVCMGATALHGLFGHASRVSDSRGRILKGPFDARVITTVHPSSLLRLSDAAAAEAEFARFVADLRLITEVQRG
jgi:uracil-DNA glycosylase